MGLNKYQAHIKPKRVHPLRCKNSVEKGQSYLKLRSSKANLERKLAAHRKSLHGRLVNDILRTGNLIKLEKLSYKAFQKLFGKSVAIRAPGMFVSHLISKAERAGGKVVEVPTYNTKLSQTCQCGRVKKKSLSERIHQCVREPERGCCIKEPPD